VARSVLDLLLEMTAQIYHLLKVYIWDLNSPSKPYAPTPGARSTKLDEMTSVAWNRQVQYVLAGASNTGYTVVWDLRGKREVVALAYGGSGSGGGMSDIKWHPDNATRLVTASEDDQSPIIMLWDLRNARAPEKVRILIAEFLVH
jgi:protein transport protein SEC31